MKTALIITTYNWPSALEQTLKSILHQSIMPDEVIVADDGSSKETKKVIDEFRSKIDSSVKHIWQEDKGFRLAMSRNRAIANSTCEYIIIIDGDMILSKKFIEDHISCAKKGRYLQGKRTLIGEKLTQRIIQNKFDPSLLSLFTLDIKNRKNSIRIPHINNFSCFKNNTLKGVRGCSFSLFKSDILLVNGFNNKFIGWGREDTEFVARLFNASIERYDLIFSAVAFHLYHRESERKDLPENDRRLRDTLENKSVWCNDGIDRFTEEQS